MTGRVRIALSGGDPSLARELEAAADEVGTLVLLPPAASDRADALLVADEPGTAGIDRLRALVASRPARPVLVVAEAAGQIAREAMAAGARGLLERPLHAEPLRAALAAAGCFEGVPAARRSPHGTLVVLGAAGGVGATSLAVAIARASAGAVLVDLDLAGGDAAAVAGARVAVPDALLALACGPPPQGNDVLAQLADADGVAVLPAPELPECRDLVDEVGVGQILDALAEAGCRVVVDAGARLDVETVPAIERASAVAVVACADARGCRGAQRATGLVTRLGLAERPIGLVAARIPPRDRGAAQALAAEVGLPLWAELPEDDGVRQTMAVGRPLPARAFGRAVRSLAERLAA